MKSRKICVVTGSRAEYGLLRPTLKILKNNPDIVLQIAVTGSHLEEAFETTISEILADGYIPDREIRIDLGDDTNTGIAASLSKSVTGFAKAFDELQPDIVVVLGDRYEAFGAAQAAMLACIPLAHIHGGEATEGLIDESIRHSITKMAHLHFTAAEKYRSRVIQLGESPDRVHNVGALCLDNLANLKLMKQNELAKEIDFQLGPKYFLLTFHPVTLKSGRGVRPDGQVETVAPILSALDDFPEFKVLITGVNADPDCRHIIRGLEEYAGKNKGRVKICGSLGTRGYLTAIKYCEAVIGNSSSGIIEAPALGTPTINIGERQRGRLRAASVIDCENDHFAISAAITQSLSHEFQSRIGQFYYPFGQPGAAKKICGILAKTDLTGILMKQFYDL